jgi:hypothetical protein
VECKYHFILVSPLRAGEKSRKLAVFLFSFWKQVAKADRCKPFLSLLCIGISYWYLLFATLKKANKGEGGTLLIDIQKKPDVGSKKNFSHKEVLSSPTRRIFACVRLSLSD